MLGATRLPSKLLALYLGSSLSPALSDGVSSPRAGPTQVKPGFGAKVVGRTGLEASAMLEGCKD